MKGLSPKEHSNMLLRTVVPHFEYKGEGDIVAFQKSGRDELVRLLGLKNIDRAHKSADIVIEYDRYAEDLCCREIRFLTESESGVIVPCHLLIPNSNTTPPLVIALHGHSTGMHVCLGRCKYPSDNATIKDQECDFAKQAVSRGYAVLILEHRGFGERGGDENGSRCTEIAFRSMMMGRTLVGERVCDTQCALDAAIQNFDDLFDKNNIICLGYSGGGTIGAYLSALDERIGCAVITSAISTFSSSIGAMPHCACNYVPSIAKYFDMGGICQLIAPKKLVVISGKNDPIFPAKGAKDSVDIAKTAFREYQEENRIIHIIADGAHKFYPNEVWRAIER